MRTMKDLRRTPSGDLDLSGGDIHFTDATLQHQADILLARPGDYRTAPLVGVGAADYLDDERPDELYAEIRRQFGSDGMEIKAVGPQTVAYYV